MSTFGAVVGERSAEGRDEFLRYHEASIELPSPALTRIEHISRDNDIFLVVGVIERDGGTLYCTVIFVDPAEGFVGKHRKLMPTASERLIWGQGGADTLTVLERQFVTEKSVTKAKLSATICWFVLPISLVECPPNNVSSGRTTCLYVSLALLKSHPQTHDNCGSSHILLFKGCTVVLCTYGRCPACLATHHVAYSSRRSLFRAFCLSVCSGERLPS